MFLSASGRGLDHDNDPDGSGGRSGGEGECDPNRQTSGASPAGFNGPVLYGVFARVRAASFGRPKNGGLTERSGTTNLLV
jgi:hypothetical protein